jgi:hypothetical protein
MTTNTSRVGAIILAIIAISLAIITLLGLAPLPFLPASVQQIMATTSQFLIQIVTVVAAFSVIIGVFNLLSVQFRKLRSFPTGIYSIVTLLTFVFVIVVHLLERFSVLKGATGDVTSAYTFTLMDVLQVTIESALAGILAFFLIYSAYRLMRRRLTLWNVVFVVSLLIVLFGYVPLSGFEFLRAVSDWVLRVPVAAGTRGLLIGIAIGTLTVGVRVLTGQDRSFRG